VVITIFVRGGVLNKAGTTIFRDEFYIDTDNGSRRSEGSCD